jgi:hypothetical protein
MKATVAGLITPHVLQVLDLAKQAQTGANVDWHLRDVVSRTVDELGQQFNARDLLEAYLNGLSALVRSAPGAAREPYREALQTAITLAMREIDRLH